MKYYAIADLHGRYDLLKKAFEEIHHREFDGNHDKIITLGDYIDRGPESRQVIECLMEQGPEVICLQGNHEAMMVENIIYEIIPEPWDQNGVSATLKSYGCQPPFNQYAYEVVPKAHLEWLSKLPLSCETEKQVFVHAGIPQYDMNLPPKDTPKGERLAHQMLWMLYGNNKAGGWKGKHVVHGHHQFADGPHVYHSKHGGRTALDTWAYHTGRLVVGVYDDSQGHAIDYIEVKK